MIFDFLIGIASSLAASFIVAVFTNKLFGKTENDVILKIYTIYIACCAFIISIMFAYMMNSDIINMLATMAEVNIFTIYKYSATSFVWIFIQLTIVTILFLIIRQIELNNKAMDKKYKDYMKTLKQSEKCGESE